MSEYEPYFPPLMPTIPSVVYLQAPSCYNIYVPKLADCYQFPFSSSFYNPSTTWPNYCPFPLNPSPEYTYSIPPQNTIQLRNHSSINSVKKESSLTLSGDGSLRPMEQRNIIQVERKPENNQYQKLPIKLHRKKLQTKNLIKNYGRAMLSFISKSKKLRRKVLKHLKIRQEEFLDVVVAFREQIHTIAALRYLWQSHPFAKAFRILCCEYLRKENLHHIFNSRVEKFDIYLKYQSKIIRSLQKPQNFESIKDF